MQGEQEWMDNRAYCIHTHSTACVCVYIFLLLQVQVVQVVQIAIHTCFIFLFLQVQHTQITPATTATITAITAADTPAAMATAQAEKKNGNDLRRCVFAVCACWHGQMEATAYWAVKYVFDCCMQLLIMTLPGGGVGVSMHQTADCPHPWSLLHAQVLPHLHSAQCDGVILVTLMIHCSPGWWCPTTRWWHLKVWYEWGNETPHTLSIEQLLIW